MCLLKLNAHIRAAVMVEFLLDMLKAFSVDNRSRIRLGQKNPRPLGYEYSGIHFNPVLFSRSGAFNIAKESWSLIARQIGGFVTLGIPTIVS
jgi:hypothetical protein